MQWLPVALGLLVLYVPTVQDLMRTIWRSDQQGHGPIVLALCGWLIYRRWDDLNTLAETTRPVLGWATLIVGLLSYIFGRSQGILLFEVGSLIPIVCGVVLIVKGAQQLKAIWFGVFFMLFLIPLPGEIVDAVTQPMKLAVSNVAEAILYAAGYPISRTGVILQIGQYRLMVADACAGLQTLFVLEAMGLLYMNVVRHTSALRNVGLAILIIPISFAANVIRVIVLSLITYHWGDEAGQGFLHGFAGIVLFLSALLLIIFADGLFRVGSSRSPAKAVPA